MPDTYALTESGWLLRLNGHPGYEVFTDRGWIQVAALQVGDRTRYGEVRSIGSQLEVHCLRDGMAAQQIRAVVFVDQVLARYRCSSGVQ